MDAWASPGLARIAPASGADKTQEWLTEAGHAIGGIPGVSPSDNFAFGGLAPVSA